MFVPYNTDAPIYYWPYATIGLIAVNVLVWLGIQIGSTDNPEFLETMAPWLILDYGTIQPVQWVTSNFVQIGFWHLAGNMFFLWAFGLVIEGKIGPLGMTGIYLGIGATGAGLEQILCHALDVPGGSYGASAVVYGLMMISLVWAPRNCIYFLVYFGLIYVNTEFEMSILVVGCFFVLMDFGFLWLQGFSLSTELLHLSGALLGLIVGIVMLKLDWVDCENWDIFAVMAGREGQPVARAISRPRRSKARKVRLSTRSSGQPTEEPILGSTFVSDRGGSAKGGRGREQRLSPAEQAQANLKSGPGKRSARGVRTFLAAIESGDLDQAFDAYCRLEEASKVPAEAKMRFIEALLAAERWGDAVDAIVLYLRVESERASVLRVKLAEILVRRLERPKQAIRVLEKLDAAFLSEKLATMREKILLLAEHQIASGVLEEQVQDW